MNLLRTILFFTWFWLVMFISIFFIPPVWVLNAIGARKASHNWVKWVTRTWASIHMFTSRARLDIRGLENIPEEGSFCLIGNHQSAFDIPLLLSRVPRLIGFVGKKEMLHIPFVRTWMKAMNCVFIDRKSLRGSIKAMEEAVVKLQEGKSLVLFPEGTRSKDGQVGKFHSAGLRMIMKAGMTIIPVSITNTGKMWEDQRRIIPADVRLTIHPPFDYSTYSSRGAEAEAAVLAIRETVVSGLVDETEA